MGKAFLFHLELHSGKKKYELVSRWCRVPTNLKIMFPSVTDICWRCNSAKGTYNHIWWECDVLCPFWAQIFQIYTEITTNRSRFPLLVPPFPYYLALSNLKNNLLKCFLSAGRQLIPRYWKTTSPIPYRMGRRDKQYYAYGGDASQILRQTRKVLLHLE